MLLLQRDDERQDDTEPLKRRGDARLPRAVEQRLKVVLVPPGRGVDPDLREAPAGVVGLSQEQLSLVYRREARVSPSVRAVARFVVDTVKKNDALILGARRTGR